MMKKTFFILLFFISSCGYQPIYINKSTEIYEFEKIVSKENKTISEVFPQLSLYVFGGVSYEPYRSTFDKLFGKKIDTLALFPASEGFFGYQDVFTEDQTDLLLLLNNDIFYEFIKAKDFLKGDYERISLKDVELGVNYLLIISTSKVASSPRPQLIIFGIFSWLS